MPIISFRGSMGRSRLQLGGMRQRVEYEIDYVPIRQCVMDVVAVPPAGDESLAAKQFQALRDGCKFLADRRDDFRHAQFPILEQIQNPQTRSISHGPKYLGSTFQRFGRQQLARVRVVLGLTFRGSLFDGAPPFHYSMIL